MACVAGVAAETEAAVGGAKEMKDAEAACTAAAVAGSDIGPSLNHTEDGSSDAEEVEGVGKTNAGQGSMHKVLQQVDDAAAVVAAADGEMEHLSEGCQKNQY